MGLIGALRGSRWNAGMRSRCPCTLIKSDAGYYTTLSRGGQESGTRRDLSAGAGVLGKEVPRVTFPFPLLRFPSSASAFALAGRQSPWIGSPSGPSAGLSGFHPAGSAGRPDSESRTIRWTRRLRFPRFADFPRSVRSTYRISRGIMEYTACNWGCQFPIDWIRAVVLSRPRLVTYCTICRERIPQME